MSEINPNMIIVEPSIFRKQQNNFYKKYPYLSYLGSNKIDGVITNHFNEQMNILFQNIPPNNLLINTPDNNYLKSVILEIYSEFVSI